MPRGGLPLGRRGWRNELAGFIAATATMIGALATQPGSTAPALTRDRVERVRRGLVDRRDRVRAPFEQAGISPAAGPITSGGSAGRNQILSYYHHIHRDWGWEPAQSQETEIAVDLVTQMLPDERLETAIVLGAGACRLPYELTTRPQASRLAPRCRRPLRSRPRRSQDLLQREGPVLDRDS